jgi:signal transduction histidine kinase
MNLAPGRLLGHRAVVDWAPAIAVVALGQANLGVDQPWTASPTARTVFAVLIGLPLGWRRRWPFASLGALVAALGVQVIAVDPSVNFGTFVALIISTYAVARYAITRTAVAGVALIAAVITLVTISGRGLSSPAEIVFPLFYLGGSWALGRAMRVRERRTEELSGLAEALRIERDQRARLAVAEERARIARELHDVVAHTVSTIVLQAEAADEIFERDPLRARQTLRTIQEGGRQGLVELRRLLGVLREQQQPSSSAPPEPQPAIGDLGALAQRMQDAGMQVELMVDDGLDALPPGLQLTAYRIVQEALTNTLKHAGPIKTEVDLTRRNGNLQIRIADKGARHVAEQGDPGHGLIGMRERVAMFGGKLETGFLTGDGFVVDASLPLEGSP